MPEASVDAQGDASDGCLRAPFTAGDFGNGAICGVGACRKTLSGTCPKSAAVDGGTAGVCGSVFAAETCNGLDDNCDGVIDEGCLGIASPSAGFECQSCAFGRNVRRAADGTIAGVAGNFTDSQNRAECVNTDLCPIPGPSWVRNVTAVGSKCTDFCASIGAACQAKCTTVQPPCSPPAASVNQANMTFGTYAADNGCMERVSMSELGTTPNTGGCDFVPKDNGFGPVPTAAFNMFCCCAF